MNKFTYKLKTLNTGEREAINIRAVVTIAKVLSVNEDIVNVDAINLLRSDIISVGPIKSLYNESKGEFGPARIITSKAIDDVRCKLDGGQEVVLTLIATDAKSNMTKAFRQMYEQDDIKDGTFEKGKGLDVLEPR
jgi:hypothetical protein